MAILTIDQNPSTSDQILFTINITDNNGNLVDPLSIDRVSIYFINRSYWNGNYRTNIIDEPEGNYVEYFSGTNLASDYEPAWESTNQGASVLTHTGTGTFTLLWQANQGEGDYFICYTWTLTNNDSLANFYQFFVVGDISETTTLPSHITNPQKYTTLFDRYMPDFIKSSLNDSDLSPDVITRYNNSVAQVFTLLENLVNQTLDVIDANATPTYILPYLARLFNVSLASNDPVLWRKQVRQAIPLYKQKGTLNGLTTALANAGITLNSFTMLWQIVSPSTWQEGIKVTTDGQTVFTLEKLAILPVDINNFSIAIRPSGTSSYMDLNLNQYVSFSNSNGVTTMTWIGESAPTPIILAAGDFLDVIYLVSSVSNQSIENYIRSLPLADQRDEAIVSFPVKNWNVRLIAENDSMFDVICNVKHPFVEPLVFGFVRTEFPYSENIYNMDTYDGSTRESTDPCDIDKSFLDTCSCCRSSSCNIALSIDNISDDRIREANTIINTYKPFHLRVQNLSFSGTVQEFMVPPIEDVEFYIQFIPQENTITSAQGIFNRSMMLTGGQDSTFNAPLRSELATPTLVVNNDIGTGFNQSYILYAPDINFNNLGINTNITGNLLEILSGISAGKYVAATNSNNTVRVRQGVPSTLPFPLEQGAHSFRLSNIIYNDATASIYQDNLFIFSDSNVDFSLYNINNILITNGTNPGTYTISAILPNNTILITGWPGSNISSLTYQLRDVSNNILASGTHGSITIQNRGRVELPDDVKNGFGVEVGYYVLYNSNQYEVNGFAANNKLYIDGYNSGTIVGTANVTILKRLAVSSNGYLDVQGMFISTGTNYENTLGIKNGQGQSIDGVADIDSNFIENYLVVINGVNYQITEWMANNIFITGPNQMWGRFGGTPINFSIVLYNKTSPIVIKDHSFFKLDRNGNPVIEITSQTVGSMAALGSGNGYYESIGQSESISIKIESI